MKMLKIHNWIEILHAGPQIWSQPLNWPQVTYTKESILSCNSFPLSVVRTWFLFQMNRIQQQWSWGTQQLTAGAWSWTQLSGKGVLTALHWISGTRQSSSRFLTKETTKGKCSWFNAAFSMICYAAKGHWNHGSSDWSWKQNKEMWWNNVNTWKERILYLSNWNGLSRALETKCSFPDCYCFYLDDSTKLHVLLCRSLGRGLDPEVRCSLMDWLIHW